MARVVALLGDLMDRSRLQGAVPDLEVVATAADAAGAAVVVVDLARHADALAEVRAVAPDAVVVAFGPHVDADALAAARAAGADQVLPRSRFFRDPAAVLTTPPDQ
ncbi:MAG TPA: DNA-binding response regulator [Acidimicrobiia bacterium]|jgi:DNA-binding NarL/FixJ family response regulator